jgi:hypothetical protein
LAPSGHNAQPWFVKLARPAEWIIGIDPKRRLPVVDPDNREALLAIGAFVENLSIAASAFGIEARMEVIAASSQDEEIIKVSLQKTKPTNYPLERITTRRTIRSDYLPTELRSDDVRMLSEPLKGRLFYFPRGTEHAKCIQEGVVKYFQHQTYRDEAQRELGEWIRFSNAEAKRHRNGLTTESMEITGFAGWYVRTFMGKDDVMKESFRKRSVDKTAKQAAEGGGWFVVTSKGKDIFQLIDTGRRFERMALMARERKVALHPMTQYLEEEGGQDEIAGNHDQSVIPQFILRVGYVDRYPDPVSLRRPVSWFLRS